MSCNAHARRKSISSHDLIPTELSCLSISYQQLIWIKSKCILGKPLRLQMLVPLIYMGPKFGPLHALNSLLPSDAMWQHRSGPTLAQVMAWCLMAPSHYMNQCWLFISEVLWHSPESTFIVSAHMKILNIKLLHLLPHLPGTSKLIKVQYSLKSQTCFHQSSFGHWWFEIMFRRPETIFQAAWWDDVNGLAQDCGNPIAYALELPQCWVSHWCVIFLAC